MGVGQSVFFCPEAFLHPVPSNSQLGLTEVLGWSSESHFLQEVFRAPSQARPSAVPSGATCWSMMAYSHGLITLASGPGLMLVRRP